MTRSVTAGRPSPLGVWPSAGGVNVAVWSTAQAVDFCLFDPEGGETRIPLTERTGSVFHAHVEGVGVGARYGLRAHGPYDPARGLRFDPAKLLADPYAVQLDTAFTLHPAMFSAGAPGVDSAPFMPKAVVTAEAAPAAPPVLAPWDRTVIYEAHVKGLTQRHPGVPEAQRGVFAGLGHPAIVDHLKALGVTTLELLPSAAWIDERHLAPLGLSNYWGYNPVVHGAPDPRLAPGGWPEILAATRSLADAGIETILDVVFNHSGEGDAAGPTLSLRGLDNPGYYRLHPHDAARYVDDTGTGNTMALDRPQGVSLAMEAMRAWVRRGGIAGFRFDLAPVLGRRDDGFDPAAPLLAAIDQDPELRGLKLIAEPWDCGPGGYQLGRFPGGWGEWNDQFRDGTRRFWRGDPLLLGRLAESLSGSEGRLGAHGRPSRGVNFVVAHDGFTLADLVSYSRKHNQANGEDNRDGTDHNSAWNNGVEGPTEDPEVAGRRRADQRALLATLILARGTPMLAMGAEFGHSQDGNNNAYAQDNPTSWLDWARADQDLLAFCRRLLRARAQHPSLRKDAFLTGAAVESAYADVEWRRADGGPMQPSDWDDPAGATLAVVLAAGSGDTLGRALVAHHRGERSQPLALPEARDGHQWRLSIDTADEGRQGLVPGDDVLLAPRSVTLLIEEAVGRSARGPSDEALAALAGAAGIAPEWWTLDGQRHETSPDVQRSILDAMGLAAASSGQVRDSLWLLEREAAQPLPACAVLRQGQDASLGVAGPDGWLEIELEGGGVRAARISEGRARLGDLPMGRHRLRARAAEGWLIAAPAQAYEPQPLRRRVGVSAQLYALRGDPDGGIGDLATLKELMRGAQAQGLDLAGINPLHCLFPNDRGRASPYYPSDRRFIDPIYISVADLPEPPGTEALVDYDRVWRAKSAGLEREFAAFAAAGGSPDFEAFVQQGGEALRRFALFHTIQERYPDLGCWDWPGGLADAASGSAEAMAEQAADRLRYHQYLQWRADRQLRDAANASSVGLLRDLAIGPAPDGAEVWARPGAFARGVSIGAPPDPFARGGQGWGMPPPLPRAWRASGYQEFAQLLRTNMLAASVLRIDHVLGLARLFWIPQGCAPGDGTYVRYPMDELLAVAALESARAQCTVVGEDLGTLPDGLRAELERNAIYSYRVLPFERDGDRFRPPSAYPRRALACVATHDLPPLAGWWRGTDIDERGALGLLNPAERIEEQKTRAHDRSSLLSAIEAETAIAPIAQPATLTDETAAEIHGFLGRSPALLLMIQAEDLAAAEIPVNIPGTDQERPNWRRRLPMPLSALWNSSRCRALLSAVIGPGT